MTIYETIIMEHYKNPHHTFTDSENKFAYFENPTCGDKIAFKIELKEKIVCVSHCTKGCAVSIASASIMTKHIQNMTKIEIENTIMIFIDKLKKDDISSDNELQALISLNKFPVRLKCVMLAWKSLLTLLKDM